MTITEIRAVAVKPPLRQPIGVGSWVNTGREFVLVWVETDDGITGLGVTYGGYFSGQSHTLCQIVIDQLAPLVVGEDPRRCEYLWEKMYRKQLMLSRRGAWMWAISAIDVALWDIKAKAADEPLARLLGGCREQLPAYATCGYYRPGWTLRDLADEIERHLAAGLNAIKLKVGALEPKADTERVRVAREVLGPDRKLAVDANNGWNDLGTAVRAVRLMERYDLWWVEEPLQLDDLRGAAKLADAVDPLIANGEQAVTRWEHRDLMQQGAAEILQLDATMAGGVSECMRSAHTAQAFDLPVVPVWFHNLHIHLAATVPHCLTVEYFLPSEGIFPFETLLEEPLPLVNGNLRVPNRPGHGMIFNQQKVTQFQISDVRSTGRKSTMANTVS
jgi:D-arabinonate dehydratase